MSRCMVKLVELIFVFAHDWWWVWYLWQHEYFSLEKNLYDFLQTLMYDFLQTLIQRGKFLVVRPIGHLLLRIHSLICWSYIGLLGVLGMFGLGYSWSANDNVVSWFCCLFDNIIECCILYSNLDTLSPFYQIYEYLDWCTEYQAMERLE